MGVEEKRKWKKRSFKAQITVFLSLLLSVVLLFLLACTEGVHVSLAKGRASEDVIAAGESLMADYDMFLWKRFHLLAIDETYRMNNEKAMPMKMEEYLYDMLLGRQKGHSFYAFQIDEVEMKEKKYLANENYYALENEIREYMKYKVPEESVTAIYQRLTSKLSQKSIEDAKKKVEQSDAKSKENAREGNRKNDTKKDISTMDESKKNQETTAGDETKELEGENTEVEKKTEDPRDALKEILDTDIVELIAGRNLNKTKYQLNEIIEEADDSEVDEDVETESHKIDFKEAEDVTSKLEIKTSTPTLSQKMITKIFVQEYMKQHFQTTLDEENGEIMNCQMEYLIAGKDSDYANVKSIINRLLAMRFAVDFAYVVTDAKRVAEAKGMATTLAGATLNPAAIELVQYLLLAAESYAEAVVDVKTLFHGGKIAYLKNASNFKCSLTNFGSLISGSMLNGDENGLDYQDYLSLLLLLRWNQDKTYHRMLMVMDLLGKEEDDAFAMEHMVYGFQLQTTVSLTPVFSHLPVYDGNGSGDYQFQYEKVFSY